MTDTPTCSECRFFYEGGTKCYSPKAEGFDPVSGITHPTVWKVRGESDLCGWNGKWFEVRSPKTFWENYGCLVTLFASAVIVLLISNVI